MECETNPRVPYIKDSHPEKGEKAMHPTLQKLLETQTPAIIDGAWGTELQKQGLKPGESPEVLNLENPEMVLAVASSYVEAGSQIILTNTFGGNRFVLERHGLENRMAEINIQGAALSKQAAQDKALVFASLGPTGKMLMMGDVEEEELFEVFAEQAKALEEGGADGLVLETMSDLDEALVALKACKAATDLPVVASMVYDSGPESDRTMMGTSVQDASKALAEAGADAVGSNCGQGIEGFVSLCQKIKAVIELPIWIKGNAGLPEMVEGKTIYKTTAEEFASFALPLKEAGASFVGGCCGTSPAFIQAVKKALS
jgi:methionine synthase I (cobalamin-dependent)